MLRKSVIYFALMNIVIGGTSSMFFRSAIQIDNMAPTLGGFLLSGLAHWERPGAQELAPPGSQFAFRATG